MHITMKKANLVLVLILLFGYSYGQKQTDYWYFGYHAGLHFSNGAVSAITDGELVAEEGSATMSDSIGNLLFYTNGVTVWNKNHQIMTNGTGLWGDTIMLSTTQAAIIIPQPQSDSLYYIFTVDGQAGYWGSYGGIAYSVVDMSLQGGNGEVVIKNTPLLTPTCEKVAAVHHSNGNDIWILTQQWGTNAKYAWLLSSAGLISTPVISNLGMVQFNNWNANDYAQGYTKFSTDGSKYACVISNAGIIEVFDFNENSGLLSNLVTINVLDALYGLEFSPDGNRLYATTWSSKLFQWDLTLGSEILINSSQTLIHQTPFSPIIDHLGALQIANDCRIYVSRSIDTLGVIQDPNLLGTSCNYIHNAINLQGNENEYGLPNFIQSYFKGCSTTGINTVPVQNPISLFPNPANTEVYIRGIDGNHSIDLTVFHVSGKVVMMKNVLQGDQIDIENLDSGIYFYKMVGSDFQSMGKIVVVH